MKNANVLNQFTLPLFNALKQMTLTLSLTLTLPSNHSFLLNACVLYGLPRLLCAGIFGYAAIVDDRIVLRKIKR